MSSIVNKIKEAVTGEPHTTTTHATTGGYNTAGGYNTTGATGMTGNNYGPGTSGTTTGTAEGMAGPHSSRLANTLDPRVDSDMDGSNRVGAGAATAGATTAAGAHHHHQYHGTGATGMTGNAYGTGPTTTTGTAEGVSGPHSSRPANAMDPRVDSDRDGSARVGGTTTGVGNTYGPVATGTTTGTTTGGLGPHSVSYNHI
jgi:hypothetical protein